MQGTLCDHSGSLYTRPSPRAPSLLSSSLTKVLRARTENGGLLKKSVCGDILYSKHDGPRVLKEGVGAERFEVRLSKLFWGVGEARKNDRGHGSDARSFAFFKGSWGGGTRRGLGKYGLGPKTRGKIGTELCRDV